MPTALLIIDMQQGSFTDSAPKFDAAGLVKRLNTLSQLIRSKGGRVIFIQHDGPPGDVHHPDALGWRLLPNLEVDGRDSIVRKKSCDSFLGTALDGFLRQHSIDSLVITGSATDYCVDTTVRSALGRGYRTTVPSDGHTCSDRPHLSAAKIIEHHNRIWADFIAPNGSAQICNCADVRISD